MGDRIELIEIKKLAPDALTEDHKSVVDAINQLAANQKAIAEAAGTVAAEDPSKPETPADAEQPVDGTGTPDSGPDRAGQPPEE